MNLTFSKINIFQNGEKWRRFETCLLRFSLFPVSLGQFKGRFEEIWGGEASKKVNDSSLKSLNFDEKSTKKGEFELRRSSQPSFRLGNCIPRLRSDFEANRRWSGLARTLFSCPDMLTLTMKSSVRNYR